MSYILFTSHLYAVIGDGNRLVNNLEGRMARGKGILRNLTGHGQGRQQYHSHWKSAGVNDSHDEERPASLSHQITQPLLGSGYLIALEILEQQTMAIGSLVQLQCLAGKLNLSVVQPLMENSFFKTPLNWTKHANMLQLEDFYNMQEWSEHTRGKGYAPLVKWEEFIDRAPREVILVQIKCISLAKVKVLGKKTFAHPVTDNKDYQHGCDHEGMSEAFEVLKEKNFKVVKKVCFNFVTGDVIPLQAFQRDIYDGSGPSRVTVIIDVWKGIGGVQRVLIKDDLCVEGRDYREYVNSSLRIVRDAQRYAEKFLTRRNVTGGYLAVMARYEQAVTSLKTKKQNATDKFAVVPYCLQKTMEMLIDLKKEVGEGLDTFLSTDFGKYGSEGFEINNYFDHRVELEGFVSRVYENRMNITEWERTFESVVDISDSGYVAKVQQAIVARAECVLFVGGGSFQRHTFHLYQGLHPSSSERCVRVVEECTNPYRPIA